MSPDLEILLKTKYPELLQRLHENAGRTALGDHVIQCGDGWFSIIDDFCRALEEVVKVARFPQPIVVQITQEAGRLRVEVDVPRSGRPDVDALLAVAQKRSATACEVCGAPAVLRWQHGVQTVCDLHANSGVRVVQDGDFERVQDSREARRKARVP